MLVMCKKVNSSPVAQMVKTLPTMQETWVWFLDQEDPLEKGLATHSSIFAWRILGQRSLASYSPWGHKESDMTEQLTLHFTSYTVGENVNCAATMENSI